MAFYEERKNREKKFSGIVQKGGKKEERECKNRFLEMARIKMFLNASLKFLHTSNRCGLQEKFSKNFVFLT